MSLFEVTAPAPMSKFEGEWKIHERNREALELHRAHGDVRKILDKSQLKRYRKLLSEIEQTLDRLGVVALIQQEQTLDAEWDELRAQQYQIKRGLESEKDRAAIRKARAKLAIVKENALSIRDDRREAKRKLHKYRKWIIRAERLRQRINEHDAGVKDEEINRRKRAQMGKEANTVAEIVVRTLNGMDFCFRTTHKGRERVISVDFERLVVTPDTIQLKLKSGQRGLFGGYRHFVPQGVKLSSVLSDEMVLAQISASIEMPVICPQAATGRWHEGFWLYIQRNGLRDGLPDNVSYSEYMKRYPAEKRHLFPFPTGVREGMWATWQYLAGTPHFLITGQTGSGKTNGLLSFISTLIVNHSPAELQLLLVDLKEGADLYGFREIPHVIGDVITDIDTVAHVVVQLEEMRRSRMDEFRRAGVRNIGSFNATHPQYAMPRVLIIFDEFAALQANAYKSQNAIISNTCSQIAMKARAAGIQLGIGVQTPRKEHISPDIRDNITFKLNGRAGTLGASLAATGSSAANKLDKRAGRFWCEDGLDAYAVQMPHITDAEVQEAIQIAKQYEPVETLDVMPREGDEAPSLPVVVKRPFGTEDFIRIVINEMGGAINYTEVYNRVKSTHEVSQSQMRKIADKVKSLESLEFEGRCYEVQTAIGRGARRLVDTGIIA